MTRYSRADWNSRPPRAVYDLEPDEVEGIALHWPAMSKPLGNVERVKSALRAWQAYHMDDRGWSDLAYQLVFDQLGNVYQGRGMFHRSGANGDEFVNDRYLAFLLVVAPGEQPSEKMIRRVRRYVKVAQRIYPNLRIDPQVVGHNDVRPEPTACPGPIVSRLIDLGTFTPPTEKRPA